MAGVTRPSQLAGLRQATASWAFFDDLWVAALGWGVVFFVVGIVFFWGSRTSTAAANSPARTSMGRRCPPGNWVDVPLMSL